MRSKHIGCEHSPDGVVAVAQPDIANETQYLDIKTQPETAGDHDRLHGHALCCQSSSSVWSRLTTTKARRNEGSGNWP